MLALDARLGHHLFEERQRAADVIARREFRHHAAVLAMHGDLRVKGVRKQPALGVVEREAGFVAGTFDAENEHGVTSIGCIKANRKV